MLLNIGHDIDVENQGCTRFDFLGQMMLRPNDVMLLRPNDVVMLRCYDVETK